jgi:outer membrane receptor protein involved in Fe transport
MKSISSTHRYTLLLTTALSGMLCAGGGTLGQAASQSSDSQGSVSEVIVTAQKRPEILKDVPISISVVPAPLA